MSPAPIAVVLAAGKGTRMGSDLPKVLHEAAGKPLVTWVLEALAAAGVHDRIVVVGYGAELVERALAGMPGVSFAVQKEQRGTGDAVAATADAIRARIASDAADSPAPSRRVSMASRICRAPCHCDSIPSWTVSRALVTDFTGSMIRPSFSLTSATSPIRPLTSLRNRSISIVPLATAACMSRTIRSMSFVARAV